MLHWTNVRVCLETTETTTQSLRTGSRFSESQLYVSDLVPRRVEPSLKRYHAGQEFGTVVTITWDACIPYLNAMV